MKRVIFSAWLLAAVAAVRADDIVMQLDASQSSPVISLNEKGYWEQTYSTLEEFSRVSFGLFTMTHCIHAYGGTDVGGGMSYWDGFTYCTSGDNTDYGVSGSSDGWIPEQWGCMAGGGISGIAADGTPVVEKGAPYLVGYWGYWIEENEGGDPACRITLNDGNLYAAKSIWVCNHPWPYYGNIHGDGFARPFTDPDDEFALYVHGLDAGGHPTGQTVKHVLANVVDGGLNQSAAWQRVDLTPLGNIGGIYFTMTSTDSDPVYGMNTACYFCVDRFTVAEAEERPDRPSALVLTPSETEIFCAWEGNAGAYAIYLDGREIAETDEKTYTITDLQPWTDYAVEVRAKDGDALSDGAVARVRTTDETAPGVPPGLTVSEITEFAALLSWEEAADNVGVKGYEIWLGDRKVSRSNPSVSYALRGLDPATDYTVRVMAVDPAGNRSGAATATFTTARSGISDVRSVPSAGAVYHDLHGRRVVNPRKGIYLLNGNKVLIK